MSSGKSLIRLKQIRRGDTLNDQLAPVEIQNIAATATTQDEIQDAILSQLKRIIFGNYEGEWNADFAVAGIKSLKELTLSGGGGGGAAVQFQPGICDGVVSIGDLVSIAGPKTAPFWRVQTVDVANDRLHPAVGVVVDKQGATNCIIQTSGEVEMGPLGYTDMEPGKRFFAFYDGRPSNIPPSAYASPTGIAMVQVIGVATGPSTLQIAPTYWVIKVRTDGMPPIPTSAASSLISATPFNCPAAAVIGDFIYLEGADTVGLACSNSAATMPCIGVIRGKTSATVCTVQFLGEFAGLADLLPDTTYYISPNAPGKIPAFPPTAAPGGTAVLQRIGSARNATTLILSIDATDFFILEG
jgi:hypothetical protein